MRSDASRSPISTCSASPRSSAARRRSGRRPTPTSASGALTETFVIAELRKQASWSERILSASHYRSGRREVDIVLEDSAGNVVGVEIEAGATLSRNDGAGLRSLAEAIGDRFLRGVILHSGEQAVSVGPATWAMPISALW